MVAKYMIGEMMSIEKNAMNEKLYDRLKIIMSRHNLNQSAFAKKVGISASYVTDIKNGRTNISDGVIALICKAFSVSENWLLTGEGSMSAATSPAAHGLGLTRRRTDLDLSIPVAAKGLKPFTPTNIAPGPPITRRVPLISNVQAGAWTETIDNFQPGDAEDWIDITSKVGPRAFALRVVGNSMEKEFQEGELVIVDPDREAASGDYVVAKINHDEATFKQLLLDAGEVFLRPLNSAYPVISVKDKGFRVVGRVVEKVKRY